MGELCEEDSLRRLQNTLAVLITALVLAACASPEEPKGEIRVMVTPSDAIVTVRDSNGNALRSQEELVWRGLTAGTYEVTATAAGYESDTAKVPLPADEAVTLTLNLRKSPERAPDPSPGSLTITIQDAESAEALEGTILVESLASDDEWERQGVTELTLEGLADGNYRVTVTVEGYIAWSEILGLQPAQYGVLTARLTRLGTIGGNVGSVQIDQIVDRSGYAYDLLSDGTTTAFIAQAGEQVGVTVRVLDETDAPLAGAPVTVNLTGFGANYVAIYPGRIGAVTPANTVFGGLRTDKDGFVHFILESLVTSPLRTFLVISATGDNNVASSAASHAYFMDEFEYVHEHWYDGSELEPIPVPTRLGADIGTTTSRYWPGEDNEYEFRAFINGWIGSTSSGPLYAEFYVYTLSNPDGIEWVTDCVAAANDLGIDFAEVGLAHVQTAIDAGAACAIDVEQPVVLAADEEGLPSQTDVTVEHYALAYVEDSGGSEPVLLGGYSFSKQWLESNADEVHVDSSVDSRGLGTLESPLRDMSDALTLINEDGLIHLHPGEYPGFTMNTRGVTVTSYGERASVLEPVRVSAEDVTIDGLGFYFEDASMISSPFEAPVHLSASSAVIRDNVFVGPGSASGLRGISVEPSNDAAEITGNTFEDWTTGIYINPSTGHVIIGNTFTNHLAGIGTDQVGEVTISDNTFVDNEEDVGLHADEPVVTGNSFSAPSAITWYGGAEVVDVQDNIFGSVDPSTATLTELAGVEDMLVHVPDGRSGFLQVRPETIFVTEDSFSINDAVEYVPEDWTVYVAEGSYNDRVLIDKAVSVITDDATLDFSDFGKADANLIEVAAAGALISGFEVRGYTTIGGRHILRVTGGQTSVTGLTFHTEADDDSYPYEIVIAAGAEDVVIARNTVNRGRIDGHPAISFEGLNDGLVIEGNQLNGGPIGGSTGDSGTITITGNRIDGAWDEGIWIAGSGSFNIADNYVDGADYNENDKADLKLTVTPVAVNGVSVTEASQAASLIKAANSGINTVQVPEGGTIY